MYLLFDVSVVNENVTVRDQFHLVCVILALWFWCFHTIFFQGDAEFVGELPLAAFPTVFRKVSPVVVLVLLEDRLARSIRLVLVIWWGAGACH
jgi:hypothetical protein